MAHPKTGFWDRILRIWIHELGNLTQIVSEISFPAFYTKIRGSKQKPQTTIDDKVKTDKRYIRPFMQTE